MMRFDAVFERGVLRPLEAVKLGDGEIVRVEVSLPRSPRQHAFFFAAIRKAYDNWPEDHPFQPMDEEQLRWWLEIQAGWGTAMAFEDPLEAASYMAQWGWRKNMWCKVHGTDVVVFIAKSIAYKSMKPADFKTLVNKVDKILLDEVGFGMSELKMSVVDDVK